MTLQVQVAEVISETPDIRTLRLVREDGAQFTAYAAGAHIDVVGPTGVLRQYSLCSPPQDPSSLLIAVKRETPSRGGSSALHEVSPGDSVTISAPRNLLTVAPSADRHYLVAGGIGVTPLLSMAYEMYSQGSEFELHYFVRSREQAAFVDLLENTVEFSDRVHLYSGTPRDELTGLLGRIAGRASSASHVYTCGPGGFMEVVGSAFAPAVGADQVHSEHFIAATVDTSADTAFDIELDTGEEFTVPADRSILEVLEENGIEVFKSCEEGICGSCVSGVLEGTPDHRDNCLSSADKAAGNQMALCVSRAQSAKLLIELY